MCARIIPLMCVVSLLVGSFALPSPTEAAENPRQELITTLQSTAFPSLSQETIGKMVDRIGEGVMKEKLLEDITKDVMEAILASVPASTFLSLSSTFTQLDSALKTCSSNTSQMVGIVASSVQKHLTPVYNKIIQKVQNLKKNGKLVEQIRNEAYRLLTAALTKQFVQKIITSLAKDVRACEGNTIQQFLRNITRIQLYN